MQITYCPCKSRYIRGQAGRCGVIEEVHICDERLAPALLLTSGLANNVLGRTDESFPEGSCFFICVSHVATARHIGEMLRNDLAKEGVFVKDNVLPYGHHVFDPRLELTWEAIEGEVPFKRGDISIVPVRPVVEVEENGKPFLPWAQVFGDTTRTDHPLIRMFRVEEGEELTFLGFTDVEFDYQRPDDDYSRMQHGVKGIGIIGRGRAEWQELVSNSGTAWRLAVSDVAARGQNSGGPVVDSLGRLVGVASASPQDGYTVISTFWQDYETPPGGGIHMTNINLVTEDGLAVQLAVKCDFGNTNGGMSEHTLTAEVSQRSLNSEI